MLPRASVAEKMKNDFCARQPDSKFILPTMNGNASDEPLHCGNLGTAPIPAEPSGEAGSSTESEFDSVLSNHFRAIKQAHLERIQRFEEKIESKDTEHHLSITGTPLEDVTQLLESQKKKTAKYKAMCQTLILERNKYRATAAEQFEELLVLRARNNEDVQIEREQLRTTVEQQHHEISRLRTQIDDFQFQRNEMLTTAKEQSQKLIDLCEKIEEFDAERLQLVTTVNRQSQEPTKSNDNESHPPPTENQFHPPTENKFHPPTENKFHPPAVVGGLSVGHEEADVAKLETRFEKAKISEEEKAEKFGSERKLLRKPDVVKYVSDSMVVTLGTVDKVMFSNDCDAATHVIINCHIPKMGKEDKEKLVCVPFDQVSLLSSCWSYPRGENYVCSYCGLACHSAKRLEEHEGNIHRFKSLFKCPEIGCNRNFRSTRDRSEHIARHNRKRKQSVVETKQVAKKRKAN